MNIASMFLRILAILGAIAAAAMFWKIGDTKAILEADLQSTQSQLTQTQGQLNNVTEEHEALKEEAATLTQNLEEAQARATTLNNQLTQVRRELDAAKQAATAREQETENLRAEAARIRRELLDERTRVSQLEETLETEDAAALRASIQELERQLLETERQIQSAGASSNAGNTEGQERPQVLRGEVVEVSQESAFVVIDLGSIDGARANSSVMIRRGPRYIGRATIRTVNEQNSIAEVSPGAQPIQPGDLAVTLN